VRGLGRAVALAALWLSPAALLGLPPAILADGTRGLAAPLALAVGAALVALLLGGFQGDDRLDQGAASVSGLAETRWPEADGTVRVLAAVDGCVTGLFAWAQIAAARDIALALGRMSWWPVLGLGAGLALALSRSPRAGRAVQVASALALLAWLVPLGAVLAATTADWPRAWRETASRPAFVFREGSPWVRGGRDVRGRTGGEASMVFADEQRLLVSGPGRLRIDHWEGGQTRQQVTEPTEVAVRPGDRLTIPGGGFPVRFQVDRRIPGAPSSGPDWLDPPGPRGDWRVLLALGLTLGLGWLGCPGVLALVRGLPTPAARVSAALAAAGMAAVMGWALYAAWLAPEIFIGGVAGVEVYELPTITPGLTASVGGILTGLAFAGLSTLGAVAVHGALRGLAGAPPIREHRRWLTIAVAALAASLAALVPADPWVVFLAALGVAASAGAPVVLLAYWSERASARGAAVGAAIGLVLYAGLSLLGIAQGVSPARSVAGSWTGWVFAWPVVVALPVATLLAWRLGSRAASPRSPVASGLERLHRGPGR
jgi:Na+/proline symporter